MAAGTIVTSLQCVLKVPNSGVSTPPCSTFGSDRFVPVVKTSYILDFSAASAIDAISAPIDYVGLGAFWGFSFSATIVLWLVAKKCGLVVDAVRRS